MILLLLLALKFGSSSCRFYLFSLRFLTSLLPPTSLCCYIPSHHSSKRPQKEPHDWLCSFCSWLFLISSAPRSQCPHSKMTPPTASCCNESRTQWPYQDIQGPSPTLYLSTPSSYIHFSYSGLSLLPGSALPASRLWTGCSFPWNVPWVFHGCPIFVHQVSEVV